MRFKVSANLLVHLLLFLLVVIVAMLGWIKIKAYNAQIENLYKELKSARESSNSLQTQLKTSQRKLLLCTNDLGDIVNPRNVTNYAEIFGFTSSHLNADFIYFEDRVYKNHTAIFGSTNTHMPDANLGQEINISIAVYKYEKEPYFVNGYTEVENAFVAQPLVFDEKDFLTTTSQGFKVYRNPYHTFYSTSGLAYYFLITPSDNATRLVSINADDIAGIEVDNKVLLDFIESMQVL